jgi:uncharacterized protein YehS (DUF1456 family)
MRSNKILTALTTALGWTPEAIRTWLAEAEIELSTDEVNGLLSHPSESGFRILPDYVLERLLDRVIIAHRGEREPDADAPPRALPAKGAKLTNNDILKKLRVAFDLREDGFNEALNNVGIQLSKSDVNAMFRKPNNKHYRACDDELLFNFIEGLGLWCAEKSAS